VHGQADAEVLAGVNCLERKQRVEAAITVGEPGTVAELIRQVDALNVLVHDDPSSLRLDRRPQMFSIDRSVFAGFLSGMDLAADPPPVLVPVFGDDERRWEAVEWRPPPDKRAAKAQLMVCLHPSVASYSTQVGPELKQRGMFRSTATVDTHDAGFTPYSYQREAYIDHVANAVERARLSAADYAVARNRLAEQLGLDEGDIEELALLAVALHDVGKLSKGWQEAIWRWQSDAFRTPRGGFLAHSDFDGSVAWQRKKSRRYEYKKPPHAAEGAYSSLPVLKAAAIGAGAGERDVIELSWALASAIARHHGARTREVSEFKLSEGASDEVRRSIEQFDVPVRLLQAPAAAARTQFKDHLAVPGRSERTYPLYLFVARRMRLADQESLSGG
jgi:CRISPR-associated endonuclease/helicase Cas3